MSGTGLSPHEARIRRTVRQQFVELFGPERSQKRAVEIAALPTIDWRGHVLYPITCNADFGGGPHTLNVPESLLWNLIDLRHFQCPWHS